MTVKELHDALSMAYWKGVQDFQDKIRKTGASEEHPPLSMTQTKEFNDDLNKLSETYIDRLMVNIMGSLKLSVR